MCKNQLDLGRFIRWDHGENYPFSACMSKLMECLGGDAELFSYNFFAGVCGDDFVFAYADNGLLNDCVSVCEETESFIRRVFGRIGLHYTMISSDSDRDELLARVQSSIDRGIPVLVKDSNFDLVFAYEDDILTMTCGDPENYVHSYKLGETSACYIFVESLPHISDMARVYRESVLQLPALMTAKGEHGVLYGPAAYRRWADDIENGRYDHMTAESFESWRDWCIYICNLATNARHGWDFLAKAYVHNPDYPQILQVLALLDRNERDCWRTLEKIGFGFNIQPDRFADLEKKAEAARIIRKMADWNDEIVSLLQ